MSCRFLLNLVKVLAQTFASKPPTGLKPLPTLLDGFDMVNDEFKQLWCFRVLVWLMFSNEDKMNFSISEADQKTSPLRPSELTGMGMTGKPLNVLSLQQAATSVVPNMRSIGTQYLVLNCRSSCKHEFETWPQYFLTIPYRNIKMTGRAAYTCMICYYGYFSRQIKVQPRPQDFSPASGIKRGGKPLGRSLNLRVGILRVYF